MDTLRGGFEAADQDDFVSDADDDADTSSSRQLPPEAIGQDERRMQVRAYNHWAGLLADRQFPNVQDLEPETLTDFGPFSVLLDFSTGVEDPAVRYLGESLADECGTHRDIDMLSDIPSRSLLSRITDHYMQILGNQAPIGFEAEFVNQRGATIMYRGILLPYSSDDSTIDFVYGVINWKEMADQQTTDELLLEIEQALGRDDERVAMPVPQDEPVADWADGPAAGPTPFSSDNGAFPLPEFGEYDEGEEYEDDSNGDYVPSSPIGLTPVSDLLQPGTASIASIRKQPVLGGDLTLGGNAPEPPDLAATNIYALAEELPMADDATGLYDCLANARELAHAACTTEDRSRVALYAAVGRAYDVSLAAQEAPEDFAEMVEDNGLKVQERAPMTPVVKLVFGSEYDKTRLTEYAAVLGHAHRTKIGRGELAGFLQQAEGGLKGVVSTERRLRREESGKRVDPVGAMREKLAEKLRLLEPVSFDELSADGQEFAVVVIRRLPSGKVAMLGEVVDDIPLVERAARKLVV